MQDHAWAQATPKSTRLSISGDAPKDCCASYSGTFCESHNLHKVRVDEIASASPSCRLVNPTAEQWQHLLPALPLTHGHFLGGFLSLEMLFRFMYGPTGRKPRPKLPSHKSSIFLNKVSLLLPRSTSIRRLVTLSSDSSLSTNPTATSPQEAES